MPLLDVDRPKYVDRRRVYLDSAERDPDNSRSRYHAVFPLERPMHKVVSAELVGFNFARCILPTFVAASTREDGTPVRGNNMLDVRLTDAADPPTQTLEFSVALPEGRFASVYLLKTALPAVIEAAMDAAGHGAFNTAGGTSIAAEDDAWDEGTDKAGGDWLFLRARQGGDASLVRMEFLFGSGAHARDSCWNVLGFREGVDAGGGGAFSADPVPARAVALQPYRWVDVFVDEIPELRPLARVHIADGHSRSPSAYLVEGEPSRDSDADGQRAHEWVRHAPRFLVDARLTLRLEFEGGVLPLEEFDRDYDLVIEFVVVSPEQGVPCWTRQVFEM
jgi:hypothetical protein